jgi:hypothetical protein
MRIVRVAHFSLITQVCRDSCVLSIKVTLLLQSNSEEIERISFVQQIRRYADMQICRYADTYTSGRYPGYGSSVSAPFFKD